ncbi:2-oxoglutarate (2OG) and Fe(II)-dependent oxygenase superfamily protein [Forsythia ovata]|uniref:2-oxoglutarate (2OG) and Fe(II)-dependent oxygenase superfamily protein n=1 Tax=Forsythia ovata TaxID=205694 RepID=A0ABD1X7Z6_9LAMI
MKAAVAAFFELPLHEKNKYARTANELQGYRQAYVVSNEKKLDWNDLLALIKVPSSFRNMNELHGIMELGVRMNYCPTCSRPDLVLGISPHSDASSITILKQDYDKNGLQIKHNEAWVPVKPVPNALVVNIGDAIKGSNGLYKSIEHRAVTNNKKSRISVATFALLDDDVKLKRVECGG